MGHVVNNLGQILKEIMAFKQLKSDGCVNQNLALAIHT